MSKTTEQEILELCGRIYGELCQQKEEISQLKKNVSGSSCKVHIERVKKLERDIAQIKEHLKIA